MCVTYTNMSQRAKSIYFMQPKSTNPKIPISINLEISTDCLATYCGMNIWDLFLFTFTIANIYFIHIQEKFYLFDAEFKMSEF